eukprot:m.484207 g.484207  ORF g.484207 m.484207 type:complete len:230 (-) comp23248_c0_seq1:52-741(-)
MAAARMAGSLAATAALLVVLALVTSSVQALREPSFSFVLPSGEEECFFEEMAAGEKFEFEFQVIAGGKLELDWQVLSPEDDEISSGERETEGFVEHVATVTGPYEFCFSNEFSHTSSKTVFLLLEVHSGNDDEYSDDPFWSEEALPEEVRKAVSNLQGATSRMHKDLNTVINIQDHLRAREARHRSIAESNNSMVQFYSVAHCLGFVLVATLQVVAVRRFFKTGGNPGA